MDNEEGGKTLTCQICIEPIISENQIKINDPNKCDHHPFCSECVIKYIQAKLEYNIAEISCPALDCDKFLDPLIYSALIGPHTFIRWCDVLCESALMDLGKSYCPNNNCSALIVDECGDTSTTTAGLGHRKKAVTKTKCPECKELFCFECMKPWHAGFSCNEAEQFMQDPNDRAFGVLAEMGQWKRCPGCRTYVERTAGCPSISCRCGVKFCYNCGAKYNGFNCECTGGEWQDGVYVILFIAVAAILAMAGIFVQFLLEDPHRH